MEPIAGACESTASAALAWSAWTAVDSWPDGDLIEHARIDGPFEMGSQITSQLRGFPETTSTVTLVDRPRRWVNEATMGDLTMTYDHVIEDTPTGCRLTESLVVTGPQAEEVAAMLREPLAALFVQTTARVARLAEASTS